MLERMNEIRKLIQEHHDQVELLYNQMDDVVAKKLKPLIATFPWELEDGHLILFKSKLTPEQEEMLSTIITEFGSLDLGQGVRLLDEYEVYFLSIYNEETLQDFMNEVPAFRTLMTRMLIQQKQYLQDEIARMASQLLDIEEQLLQLSKE